MKWVLCHQSKLLAKFWSGERMVAIVSHCLSPYAEVLGVFAEGSEVSKVFSVLIHLGPG